MDVFFVEIQYIAKGKILRIKDPKSIFSHGPNFIEPPAVSQPLISSAKLAVELRV